MKKKKIIHFDSSGKSGNIFHILWLVQNVMAKEQKLAEFNQLQEKVSKSNSYKEALSHISEYVNLVDEAEKLYCNEINEEDKK